MAQQQEKQSKSRKRFVNDKHFQGYSKPNMVKAANEMLCNETLSEEGFLGAQAVLLINGIL